MSERLPPLPLPHGDRSAAILYLGPEEIPSESPSLERIPPGPIPLPVPARIRDPVPLLEESEQVRALKHYENKRLETEDRKQLELARAQSVEWTHQEWRKRQRHWTIDWSMRSLADAVDLATRKGGYSGIWIKVPSACTLTRLMIEELRHEPAMIRCQWSLDKSGILFLSFFEMTGTSVWETFKQYKHVHLTKNTTKEWNPFPKELTETSTSFVIPKTARRDVSRQQ